MQTNICCIFNLAPHYRAPIYKLMDNELNCDFYITTGKIIPFQQMNYGELKGFKKTYKNVKLTSNLYWQTGILSLPFRPYKHYIINGDPFCLTTWLILLLNKMIGKKTYLWSHGWYGNEASLKKTVKKIFLRLTYKVLLYGNYARNLMIEEGFDPDKLICIYNSLDYDSQVNVRKTLSSSPIYREHFCNDFPVLVYIGRIQKVKKIELLIQALYELRENGKSCNLIIIGKEKDKTDIHKHIKNYNLNNNVWFYGECYNEEEIGKLIYNADICISPGNIGLTAMHSLIYGTPIITHGNFHNQMPEFEAIIPGITGDFFLEDSVEDLCAKIVEWSIKLKDNRVIIRNECYKIIDQKYNPHLQIEILTNTING